MKMLSYWGWMRERFSLVLFLGGVGRCCCLSPVTGGGGVSRAQGLASMKMIGALTRMVVVMAVIFGAAPVSAEKSDGRSPLGERAVLRAGQVVQVIILRLVRRSKSRHREWGSVRGWR